MPTLAEIAEVDPDDYSFQGTSLLKTLDNPKVPVQDQVHFTFDDSYIESPQPQTMGACRIRCIITTKGNQKWKYAVYFDPNYGQEMEYEMYDLTNDSEERYNLAHHDLKSVLKLYKDNENFKAKIAFINKKRQELHQQLTDLMIEKGTMPDTVIWPEISGS